MPSPMIKDGVIRNDLRCAVCAYNLRGLAVEATCPECGLSAQESLLSGNCLRKRELAKMLFRILSVWVACDAVLDLAGTAETFVLWGGSGMMMFEAWRLVLYCVGVLFVMGLVACGLWFGAGKLAALLFPSDGMVSIRGRLTGDALMGVAMAAIGSFFVISGVLEAMALSAALIWTGSNDAMLGGVFVVTVKCLVGLSLLIGWGQFHRVIQWMRTAGAKQYEG